MEKKVYRSRFGWLFVGVLLSSQVYAQTFIWLPPTEACQTWDWSTIANDISWHDLRIVGQGLCTISRPGESVHTEFPQGWSVLPGGLYLGSWLLRRSARDQWGWHCICGFNPYGWR